MPNLQLFENAMIQDIDDILWIRAARRECLEYGEHGIDTEIQDGKEICFNCGGRL